MEGVTGNIASGPGAELAADSTRTGCVASGAGLRVAALVAGSDATTDLLFAGCPQFVQNAVPGSSLLPQLMQNAVGVAGAVAAFGASAATTTPPVNGASSAAPAGAVSTTGEDSVPSRLPHSVQKTEPGSPCAPHEEQIARVTETAADGCAAAGIGLPHDVQKLADSST